MNVTPEVLAKAKALLKTEVSEAVLQGLLEKIPNEAMMPMSLSLMEEPLRSIPADTPAEQAVAMVMGKMKRLSDSQKADNPGNSKKFTRQYFDQIWLEQRLMDAQIPDTSMELFGETFASPIMTAALSHLKLYNPDVEDPMVSMALAAKQSGIVHWIGMCENDEYDAIAATGARIIRIIKPYADEAKIYDQIRHAEQMGALAVGIDIDHTFTVDGDIDAVHGEKLAPKSSEMIQKYIESTKLPFVIKGVLSAHDAIACAKIGVKGIMVSHHGGRMPFAVPPLVILPEIVAAVGDQMEVFVDCGIASGADIYKVLATGAKAVGVGTHLIPYLRKGGSAGVSARIHDMTMELKGFMANTGVGNTNAFDPSVLHYQKG